MKKGIQLNQAFGAILSLILVAILVIVGVYLFTTLGSSFAGSATGSTINESVTMTGPTVSTLANSTLCQFSDLSVTAVNNGSNTINSGNYTVGTNSIVNTTSSFLGTWKVSYTYEWGGYACTASDNMTIQFATYPTLVGLIGTIILLAIVIGVLVASFAFGGKKGA